MRRLKYWEIIPANLSKAGWSWGCVSAVGIARVEGFPTTFDCEDSAFEVAAQ
jgi:hypothetical protein